MNIGENLKIERKRAGISQKELARISNVSISAIQLLEQGRCSQAKYETTRRLAAALKIPLDSLDERYRTNNSDTVQDESISDEQLLHAYHALNLEGKVKAKGYLRDLGGNPIYKAPQEKKPAFQS